MSTVTVVATVEPSTGPTDPPRVKLDVTDTGTPNLFSANVFRINPDGRSEQVRGLTGGAVPLTTSGSDRVGSVYDYEAPFGQGVWYSTTESPENLSAMVTVDEPRPWLIHPGVPEMSRPFTIASISERSRSIARGIHYPMGRATPIVVTSGRRRASEYVLTALTQTEDEADQLENLLDDGSPLLLNVPAGLPWRIATEYVSVGDVTESRVSPYLGEPLRRWTLPLTVVSRPAGGSQSERTLTDLLVYPTLNALKDSYATLNDLLAGP